MYIWFGYLILEIQFKKKPVKGKHVLHVLGATFRVHDTAGTYNQNKSYYQSCCAPSKETWNFFQPPDSRERYGYPNFPYEVQIILNHQRSYVPMENVILCLSLFAFGLRMFMALLRLELEKCLMNVASTLSISLETCNGKWHIILQGKALD